MAIEKYLLAKKRAALQKHEGRPTRPPGARFYGRTREAVNTAAETRRKGAS
jgi:hypothetical protein